MAEDRKRISWFQDRDGSAGEVVEGFGERRVKPVGHSVATSVELQRNDLDGWRHQGCPPVIAARGAPGVGQTEKFHRYGPVFWLPRFRSGKGHRRFPNTPTADRSECERSAKLFITRTEAPLPSASPCIGFSGTLAEPVEEWPGPQGVRGV
ncbi:hypothetical protein STAN_6724 [Streptomyces sp. CBMAI 2042]|nr:hypothetical protein STAN_6724 [Streptomyces sp. CBMAI 2042]